MKSLLPLACIAALAAGPVLAAKPAESTPEPLPLDELNAFAEAFQRIKSSYVENVDDKTLLQAAIAGMVGSLDPHSSYLVGEDLENLQSLTSGEYGGLGIEISQGEGYIRIIAPMDDTPAAKAGVLAGDLIVKIDGTALKGDNLGEAIERMRGKVGEKVVLTLVREGQEQPFDVTLVREVIKVTSVRSRLLDPGYGYVRISQFQARTGNDLRNALGKLNKDNKDRLRGLVLDLRNNPGGVLNAAIDVSDAFLKEGAIVSTKGRNAEASFAQSAKPDDLLFGAPLVVLVNAGSASASEIVAGALQDHKRAVIVGTRSFGKGSVQTILPLSGNGAVKLTTALYYTPKGRSIQATGIEPDIEVAQGKLVSQDSGAALHEADLPGRLNNGEGKNAQGTATDKAEQAKAGLAQSDYQLHQALNLLKGISLLGMAQPKI
ncbi:MAG: S41 family peptidase [Gammaproteobacteria bacterium]|nr:S41 family peptidase [Gammaproteobacteria bacterium]